MLYVAAMPVPVYVLALGGIAVLLLRAMLSSSGAHPLLATSTILITLTGIALAFAALWFTSEYSISRRACYTGIFGFMAARAVIVAEVIGLLAVLAIKRPETVAWLKAHKGLVSLIVAGQVTVALVLARSHVLCTV